MNEAWGGLVVTAPLSGLWVFHELPLLAISIKAGVGIGELSSQA